MDSQHASSSLEKCFASDHDLLLITVGWVIDAIDRKKSQIEVARLWANCTENIAIHMEVEETNLLSELALVREAEARALLAEHRFLRDRLAALTEKAANGRLSVADLGVFRRELEAHSAHEERALYNWSASHFSLSQLSKVLSYMNQIAKRRSDHGLSAAFSRR